MPLNSSAIFPAQAIEFASFPSRRSVVHSTKGIVSCTQPLAAKCGIEILHKGGNCADAAVAVAAGLNMTEPGSTGIGGDMFCLFYNAKTKKVHAMNGSGRAGKNCTLEAVRGALGLKEGEMGTIPMGSPHAVTVPGAAAGWVDTVEKFGSGKLSMEEILDPAIRLGEEGFPVSELMAEWWSWYEQKIKEASPNGAEMLKKDPKAKDGCRAPRHGEIMKNSTLSNTFRLVGKNKKAGFYIGSVAEELVKVVKDLGGFLTLEDLETHMKLGTEEVEPISLKFRAQDVARSHGEHMDDASQEGIELWEHPPNGQGIVALMALGIIEQLEKAGKIGKFSKQDHNSAAYLHTVVEALRIAFADGNWWIADPNVEKVPSQQLISPEYLAERAKLFDVNKASPPLDHGSPAHNHSDTVYFACTDSEGNGISFINSNYAGFGTCIVPKGCGFTLQNRGANFALQPSNHPNILAANKRPYHTIIPALVTNTSDQSLHSVYGVMGGFMQPQGHVQVLLNQLVFGMTPQAALDAPRVCIGAGMPDAGDVMDRTVYLEDGIPEESVKGLRDLGHKVEVLKGMDRGTFGRGQIIRWHLDPVERTGVWSAGSDMRGDGHAVPAFHSTYEPTQTQNPATFIVKTTISNPSNIQYSYLDSSADWDSYLAYRPSYPHSIETLILTHHRFHSNSFRLAHDIGSGSAVFVPTLAKHFEHVHVSDPSATTLAKAKDRLSSLSESTAEFTFSQTSAEEANLPIPKGSVDLCTLMMSAHWADVDTMIAAVAESLAPKGTLAICMYQPSCFVVGNEVVNQAVRRLYAKWGELFAPTASDRIEKNSSPLDFVPLRNEVFIQEATKRIKLNFRDRGDGVFAIPGLEGRVAVSRVGALERMYWYNDEDEDGSGWRREVDASFFQGSIASLEKPERFSEYETHFRDIERVIRETTTSGKVVVEWVAALLLATKE